MIRLLILLLLILPNCFYAQTIASISSNEQARAFMKKVDPEFVEKQMDAEMEHTRDSIWSFLKLYNYYEKADFDNNGHIDLLFNGCLGCEYKYRVSTPLVILSYGNDSFQIKDISCSKCVIYSDGKTVQVNGRPMIEIICAGYEHDSNERTREIKRVDTLMYAFNEFIEYARPAHHAIEKISLTYSAFTSYLCDSFSYEVTFSHDSTWLTRQIHCDGDWRIKKYVAQTDTETWNRLTGLLNGINFPKLKKYYGLAAHHEPFGFFSVSYDNKKEIRIRDYGLEGTYGLNAVYGILYKTASRFAGRLIFDKGGMLGTPF